jgi:hypothetical protein
MLWKRRLCGNIIEVIIPILFISFIVVLRTLIPIVPYPETSFLNNPSYPSYTNNLWGQQSTAVDNGNFINLKAFSTEDWGCRPDMVVGLAPAGSPLVASISTKLTAMGYTVE